MECNIANKKKLRFQRLLPSVNVDARLPPIETTVLLWWLFCNTRVPPSSTNFFFPSNSAKTVHPSSASTLGRLFALQRQCTIQFHFAKPLDDTIGWIATERKRKQLCDTSTGMLSFWRVVELGVNPLVKAWNEIIQSHDIYIFELRESSRSDELDGDLPNGKRKYLEKRNSHWRDCMMSWKKSIFWT